MKKAWISISGALVVVLLAAGFWMYRKADANVVKYRLASVERGNLQATVSATGKLSAVTTVQVGTQVSGQVSQIAADFNQHVKKGQLLARIDPTLQQQAVQEAQAAFDRSQAQLEQTTREYQRNKELFDAKVITETEFNTAQYNHTVAVSNVKSGEIALERARHNLGYTAIYAPIDGVVVERNVDLGQTVAASLSAPQLFLIANDLRQMQILASVDESDIGMIHEGQAVQFTVQPYPNQNFTGTVKQVRLQSTTTDNVVNYTVVVEVKNENGKLLPGMTATLNFVTGTAENTLMVPNAALRFRPTADVLNQMGVKRDSTSTRQGTRTGVSGDSTRAKQWAGRSGSAAGGQGATRTSGQSRGTLWVIGADGKPAPARVQVGITDGQKTAVTSTKITEGTQVILGLDGASATTTSASTAVKSPFQPQRTGGGPPRGGM
jgi:HlyD family secretion protein